MAETTMVNLHDYTSEFLVPFAAASAMENDGSDSSPWMIRLSTAVPSLAVDRILR